MKIIEYGKNWFIEDQLDNELLNEIKNFFDKNLEFLTADKENYSTTGDNAQQYWLCKKTDHAKYVYTSKEYELLEQKFNKQIFNRLVVSSLFKNTNFKLEQATSWTVAGREGSFHTVHTHTGPHPDAVSVVLYLNVPDTSVSKICSEQNSIFLIMHADPETIYQQCPSIYHIYPEIGTLLIFPTHLPHGTYPQSDGLRQTFNVNYEFTKNLKKLDYA